MAPLTRRRKKALAAAAPVIDPNDRISKLHEEIQAHILSFLPAQEAVRTCVLARTWRNRWKLTRRLLITGDDESMDDPVQEVRGFTDRLLRLRLDGLDDDDDMAPIEACEIMLKNWCGDPDYDDDDRLTVWSWIRSVLECQLQSLRVDIWRDGSCTPMGNIDLVLVSRHLTRLELNYLGFLDSNGCLNFSGCPSLEHLEVTSCDLYGLTKMTSPSVKRLVMTYCDTDNAENRRLEICFPRLVSLCLEDFFDNTPVLESMPQLSEAYVYTNERYSNGHADCGQDITKCVVLEGLAQAKHLVLLSDEKTLVFRWDLRWCPTFSNLKTLVLNDYWCESVDCSELACMLEHAPVLEKLTVLFSGTKVEPKYDVIVEGRPNATGKSIMISQHLKIVEVKYFEVHQRVLKVLKFLGTHNIWFQFRETEGSK